MNLTDASKVNTSDSKIIISHCWGSYIHDVTQFWTFFSPIVTLFITKAFVLPSQNPWPPPLKTVTSFMDDPLVNITKSVPSLWDVERLSVRLRWSCSMSSRFSASWWCPSWGRHRSGARECCCHEGREPGQRKLARFYSKTKILVILKSTRFFLIDNLLLNLAICLRSKCWGSLEFDNIWNIPPAGLGVYVPK